MAPADIVEAVTQSGLRGRGGAAFPTGIKWKTVLNTAADQKYVVCNADEGDSGTFSDRMVMEGDPLVLVEGMTIAGVAVGATRGYIYLRSEYPHALRALNEAIAAAYARGFLGPSVARLAARRSTSRCGSAPAPTSAAKRPRCWRASRASAGMVRFKPPLPAIAGLFGKPTVINNVISFASVPIMLDRGAEFYRDYGMGRSRGTLPIQLAGNIKHGGLVEKAFGVTLRELLYDYGGGSRSGRPIRTVQVGGPLGAFIPESQFDLPLDYEAFAAKKRHGGPRRHRGVRRHRGYGRHGALRHGVLRDRIVRQVHAVPDRLDPRGRGDGPGHRRPGRAAIRPRRRRAPRCSRTCATPWSPARSARWAGWRRSRC